MRYTAAIDTDPNLTTLLETAQREPVFIERDQQEIAVRVSARDYDRLSGKSLREFNAICDQIADEAAAKGLTEATLQEILDHV
jgi:PHD/YefM family antitoxin component YafN of YafNO toxin-antitoxin module